MHGNPFSPSFSIHPSQFYGRESFLRKFGEALDTMGSADRCFFLTGIRGTGKTSLLHQYSELAKARKWDVVNATYIDALDQMLEYAGIGGKRATDIQVGVSLPVPGAPSGRYSRSETSASPASLLGQRLGERLGGRMSRRSLLICIDEAQKIKREDMVRIGVAVQHVKSEGMEIALVLGGLPSAFTKVRAFRECTFLRRMGRENLWCMTRQEATACLESAFSRVPEIGLTQLQLKELVQFSGGHPYLMQLLGDRVYKLMAQHFAPERGIAVALPEELIDMAEESALADYKANVLDDVLSGMRESTRDYIRTAFLLEREHGAVTAEMVSEHYGRTRTEMGSVRDYAMKTQVIREAKDGTLRFTLPHYRYIFEDLEIDQPDDEDDGWDYREV